MRKPVILMFIIFIYLFLTDSAARCEIALVLPTGEKIYYKMKLPKNYTWDDDKSLITPYAIKIFNNGDVADYKNSLSHAVDNLESSNLVLPDGNIVIYESSSTISNNQKNFIQNSNEDYSIPDNYNANNGWLRIPDNSIEDKDLSFLEGCWKADKINYYTDPKRPYFAPAELCFNRNGVGIFHAYPKNTFCEAEAVATFRGNKLFIQTNSGTCAHKSRSLMPRTFLCDGTDENTECYILANSEDATHKSEARFYKK